jgi:hypothetical protein
MTIVILVSIPLGVSISDPLSQCYSYSPIRSLYSSREVEGYYDESDTIQYGIEIQTERSMTKHRNSNPRI